MIFGDESFKAKILIVAILRGVVRKMKGLVTLLIKIKT